MYPRIDFSDSDLQLTKTVCLLVKPLMWRGGHMPRTAIPVFPSCASCHRCMRSPLAGGVSSGLHHLSTAMQNVAQYLLGVTGIQHSPYHCWPRSQASTIRSSLSSFSQLKHFERHKKLAQSIRSFLWIALA